MADVIQTTQVLPAQGFAGAIPKQRFWRGHLQASEYFWALAFLIPYAVVFLAFVAYPIGFGIWMGSEPEPLSTPARRPDLLEDGGQHALYLGIAINVKLFLALMLSGFFMRKGWWVKALLMIFVLPWAVPAIPTYISIHWMLNGEWGLINNLIWHLFRQRRPALARPNAGLALGSVIVAHIWKWLPFWTMILLAGRMAIPPELYEAARGRRRDRLPPVRPRQLPADRQPLPDLHAALDDLLARRLQRGLFRHAAAARPIRRTCWRPSASATPSRWPSRGSAWRR